ncbi:MAG: hypothetical protein QXK47_03100 [Candidatus Bathyarchaeia archaeon]
MTNRKFMAIPILLIFALVATGLAYAHWTKTFTIIGNVDTTELDWEFQTPISCLDKRGENDWVADCEWNFWQGDKDVGGPTQLKLVDTDVDGDYDKLEVTLVNVYPSYAEEISFYVHNNGEMPLIFKKVVADGKEITPSGPDTVFIDVTGDGKYDLKIRFGNNLGLQFEPCTSKEISVSILVLQDAPQGQTLTFYNTTRCRKLVTAINP